MRRNESAIVSLISRHWPLHHDRPLRNGQGSLALKAAALKLRFVTEEEFERVVDPAKMVKPYVATDK